MFKNSSNNPRRNSFDEYYKPLVEIKDFNALKSSKKQTRSVWKTLLKCQETMIIQQEIY